jgi:hypothetical protein
MSKIVNLGLIEELKELLKNITNKNTIETYTNSYYRLLKTGLFSKSINETEQEEIIHIINSIDTTANTRYGLLNIAIKLKDLVDADKSRLIKFQHSLSIERQLHIKEQKPLLNDKCSDISLEDLNNYLENLYTSKLYVKYIVNYLFIKFGVRNQDVNVLVIKNKKYIKSDENYLLVSKSKVEYIRKKYKTHSVYGDKTYTITDKKFVKAVNELEREEEEALLKTRTGQRLSSQSQNRVIQDMTYNKLGEGNMYKCLVNIYKHDNDMLIRLSNSRGSSMTLQNGTYSIEDMTEI